MRIILSIIERERKEIMIIIIKRMQSKKFEVIGIELMSLGEEFENEGRLRREILRWR